MTLGTITDGMAIASWNVNSLNVRLPHVLQWLENNPVDVLGLQETKLVDAKFPARDIQAAGYQVAFSGQPTYNGVALLSKTPAQDIITDPPNVSDEHRRIIAGTVNGVRIINLYVVNGKAVDDEKYVYKLDWLKRVSDWIETELEHHPQVVVMGDFNIAPADDDIHDPDAWRDKILCSAPERSALQRLLDMGLVDTFRQFEQEPATFSWWDYRQAAFRRNMGLRIDLVLASAALAAKCQASCVDKEPRKWERPSDHAPVVASFKLS